MYISIAEEKILEIRHEESKSAAIVAAYMIAIALLAIARQIARFAQAYAHDKGASALRGLDKSPG